MTVISWKSRHPERHAGALKRQTATMAQKFTSGRGAKDALMPALRERAASGAFTGWAQVLEAMERAGEDTAMLRIWATAKDRSEIDRLCGRARGRGRLAPSRFKPRAP